MSEERDRRGSGVIDKPRSLRRASAFRGIGVRPVRVRRSKLREDHVDMRADWIASGTARLSVAPNGRDCANECQRCAEKESSHPID